MARPRGGQGWRGATPARAPRAWLPLIVLAAASCGGPQAPCATIVDVYVAALAGLVKQGNSQHVVIDTGVAPLPAHVRAQIPAELLKSFRAAQGSSPHPRCGQELTLSLEYLDAKGLDELFSSEDPQVAWAEFESKYKTEGYWTLSAVGFDKEYQEAVCLVGYLCGPRCGHGHLVHLEKEEGFWNIIDVFEVWQS